MRSELFIVSILCLCYVISAVSKENLVETKLEANRSKRTIILTTIQKMLWHKFSSFVNLPITRKPPINFTTLRNRIPSGTKQSATLTSVFFPTGSSAFIDMFRGNSANTPSNPAINNNKPKPGPSTEQNNGPNSVDYQFSSQFSRFINNRNKALKQQFNNYGLPYDPSKDQNNKQISGPEEQNSGKISGNFTTSRSEVYTDPRNGPRKQLSNNYKPPIAEQTSEQNFGKPSTSQKQNFEINAGGFAFPALKGFPDFDNSLEKQQSNNFSLPSGPSAERNISRPKEENQGQTPANFSASGPDLYTDSRNGARKQQSNDYAPHSGPSAEQNYKQHSGPGEQNYGKLATSNKQNYGKSDGSFPLSAPEGYTHLHNGPGRQQSNNYGLPFGPSAQQHYKQNSGPIEHNHGKTAGSFPLSAPDQYTDPRSVKQESNNYNLPSGSSAEQNYKQISGPIQQNHGTSSGSFPISASPEYTDPRNGPGKQQSNNYGQPSSPSEVNYGSTDRSIDTNYQHQSSPNLNEEEFIDYSFNPDKPLKQNYEHPSGPTEQNHAQSTGSFPFSAPEEYTDPRIEKKQPNNYGLPPGHSAEPNSRRTEENHGPSSGSFPISAPEEYSNPGNGKQQPNNYGLPPGHSAEPNSRRTEENHGPSSGSFPISAPEEYSNPGNGKQQSNNYGQPSGPSAEQKYKQNFGSTEQNDGPSSGSFPVSAPDEYNDPHNGPRKQQLNIYVPPSGPSEVQNYESSDHRSNEGKDKQQSPILNREQFIDYSFNPNKPFESSYPSSLENKQSSVNQLAQINSNSDSHRFSGQKNSQFEFPGGKQENEALYPNVRYENINKENQQKYPIYQSNPTHSPFLMNYPHHQHYQQLIPSVNKLSNQNSDISQNNYQQQIYSHEEDSLNFNEYNQLVLNH